MNKKTCGLNRETETFWSKLITTPSVENKWLMSARLELGIGITHTPKVQGTPKGTEGIQESELSEECYLTLSSCYDMVMALKNL